MANSLSKVEEEKNTIEIMIKLYCNKNHGSKAELCADCKNLLEYAHKRLDNCKFGNSKRICGRCKVHCYKQDMREKIIQVMRFSGPRMIYSHPILAFRHLVEEMK